MKLTKETIKRIRKLNKWYEGRKVMWKKALSYHKDKNIEWAILKRQDVMTLKNTTFREIISRQKNDNEVASTIRQKPTAKVIKKIIGYVKAELMIQIEKKIIAEVGSSDVSDVQMYSRYNIAVHNTDIKKIIWDVTEMVIFLYYNEPPKKKKKRIFF